MIDSNCFPLRVRTIWHVPSTPSDMLIRKYPDSPHLHAPQAKNSSMSVHNLIGHELAPIGLATHSCAQVSCCLLSCMLM